MDLPLFVRLVSLFLLTFSCATAALSTKENFIVINGKTNEVVLTLGSDIDKRVTPCSTFKIVLSLMGYDDKILLNEEGPIWDFQEGYDDYLESWKAPQSPRSWMKNSCIWYSSQVAFHLGSEKMQNYLNLLEYGNQDISGCNKPWINSSLKVSPKEQVQMIHHMVRGKLPVSTHAYQMTKALLFQEELPDGWKLFGKTGWTGSRTGQDGQKFEIGWFVGWVEKDNDFFPFAYNIYDTEINLAQRIPRVKELLERSNAMADYDMPNVLATHRK